MQNPLQSLTSTIIMQTNKKIQCKIEDDTHHVFYRRLHAYNENAPFQLRSTSKHMRPVHYKTPSHQARILIPQVRCEVFHLVSLKKKYLCLPNAKQAQTRGALSAGRPTFVDDHSSGSIHQTLVQSGFEEVSGVECPLATNEERGNTQPLPAKDRLRVARAHRKSNNSRWKERR